MVKNEEMNQEKYGRGRRKRLRGKKTVGRVIKNGED